MSFRSEDLTATNSAASKSTGDARLALLSQLEATEDSAVSNGSGGESHGSRNLSIEPQDEQGKRLIRQDNNGEHPTIYMYMQADNHGNAPEQESGSLALPESFSGLSSTILEKPSVKAQRSLVSRMFVDSWIWESLCWLLSVACLATITIILHTYDGKPLPQWKSGITLNALVSVFTAIAKAAVLFPISQSISQLKWVWFSKKSRKLQDFETFDDASKSIWGSILLLCTPKPKHWVSLGAIAMIAGGIVEPFTQQVISFPQRLAPSQEGTANATVAYSQNFIAGMDSPFIAHQMDSSMMLSIYSGVLHPANVSIEPVAPDCTTGNCTFPEFLSIAVCAKGANITHLLSQPNGNFSYTLPNGMSIFQGGIIANISTDGDYIFRTLAFPDVANPLVNVFVIYDDLPNPNVTIITAPRAAEFVLEYCVKRYHIEVFNGRPKTTELATYTTHRFYTMMVFSVPDSPATYNISDTVRLPIQSFMDGLFWGPVYTDPVANTGFIIAWPIIAAMTGAPFNQAGMQRLMDNLAMSITNDIRSRNNNDGTDGGAPLRGVAYSIVPFVYVQWEWLSVLVVLELLALVLLVSTVLQSRRTRMKLWKSSSLAVLRAGAGVDEGLRRNWVVGGMGRMGMMEMEGKGVGIILVNETGVGGGGWRLVKG